jgi:hypothetical protein
MLVDSILILEATSNFRHRAPTSGGQYHWVSEFAPPSLQKFLSYVTGEILYLRFIELD